MRIKTLWWRLDAWVDEGGSKRFKVALAIYFGGSVAITVLAAAAAKVVCDLIWVPAQ
jgi:hypothetical protein